MSFAMHFATAAHSFSVSMKSLSDAFFFLFHYTQYLSSNCCFPFISPLFIQMQIWWKISFPRNYTKGPTENPIYFEIVNDEVALPEVIIAGNDCQTPEPENSVCVDFGSTTSSSSSSSSWLPLLLLLSYCVPRELLSTCGSSFKSSCISVSK
jgi:hypothetical protein